MRKRISCIRTREFYLLSLKHARIRVAIWYIKQGNQLYAVWFCMEINLDLS